MQSRKNSRVIFICPYCGNASRKVPVCGVSSRNGGTMYPIGLCVNCGPLNLELLARFAGKPPSPHTGTNRKKSMKPGDKIRTIMSVRSQRTGLILPREGIFVGARENIGRTLILVDFGEAGTEYLLPHEIEEAKRNQGQAVEINERRPKW